MKSILPRILTVLTAPILISTSASAQDEELIFQERFINTSGENVSFDDLGWSAYITDPNTGSVALDVSTLDNQPNVSLAGISGDIGYETCFCDDDGGLIFQWHGGGGRESWFVTTYEDVTINRSEYEITRVTWADKTGNPDDVVDHEVRFIVKIEAQWYVTATAYDPHEGVHEDQWALVEHTFTTAESDWLHLIFTPGSALELGENVAGGLPDGNIDGVGFYFFHPNMEPHGSVLVDDLEIYAKPAAVNGDTWGPYPIVKDGSDEWVNTTTWMGWLEVSNSPWNYSRSLDGWVYVDEEDANADAGAWVYVIK